MPAGEGPSRCFVPGVRLGQRVARGLGQGSPPCHPKWHPSSGRSARSKTVGSNRPRSSARWNALRGLGSGAARLDRADQCQVKRSRRARGYSTAWASQGVDDGVDFRGATGRERPIACASAPFRQPLHGALCDRAVDELDHRGIGARGRVQTRRRQIPASSRPVESIVDRRRRTVDSTADPLHPNSAGIRLDNSLNDLLSLERRGRPSRRADVPPRGLIRRFQHCAARRQSKGTQFRR